MQPDYLDAVIAEWNRERPDLDTSGLAVAGRIVVLGRHIENRIDRMLKSRFGVPLGGFDVLAALRRSGPEYALSPTQLMRDCLLTSGAVTNRIDRMEAMGLLERAHDTRDRRSVKVILTEKGRDLVDRAMPERVELTLEAMAVLSERDRTQLQRLLRKFLVHVERLEAQS